MEKPEGEGGPMNFTGAVSGAMKAQLGGIVSTTSMIKRIVFGSWYKFLLFATWLATLLGTVIMHANYESWHVKYELLTAFFYLSLDGLRIFFFLLSLVWQLGAKRMHKGVIFLLAAGIAAALEIVPILLLKYVSEEALNTFDMVFLAFVTILDAAAVMAEKWRTIEVTAPLAGTVARKLKLSTRHFHPMRWIAIEMTVYIAIKEVLHFFILPASVRLNTTFLFWYFGDYFLNLMIVVSYFIIRTRNDPYHHHLKSIIMCAVLLMQGWGLLQMVSEHLSELGGWLKLPFLAELLVLAGFSIWQVGSDAAQKEESERDADKLYAYVLWTFAITAISAFYDAWGLNDIFGTFAFMALGVGVIFFVKESARNLAPRYGIRNFKFGTFGANKLAYASGEPVAAPKKQRVRDRVGTRASQPPPEPARTIPVTAQPSYVPAQPSYVPPAASDSNFCNQCGKPVPAGDARFCKYCGAKFTADAPTATLAATSAPTFCKGCGHQVDKPGAAFCRYCGRKF